ncbi:MAG: MBL fold metallo-hydrolase [Alphaproteobacteria bacterium HGW-Alphaproteobacteria-1]|jgi:quinoprotein relay system zinc metallohydrolase 2|nr:MAG: MBL fold metallo-hydrolase [Alphaproteobacteria bacterium HGW-Alphaproteobacteria-1]
MFEAILTLCLAGVGGDAPCREVLLPGYEATTEAACVAALAARAPDGAGEARCAPLGAALDVDEIAPGVFVHLGQVAEPDQENLGDASNLGFVVGREGVAVIDTGAAAWMGEALWRAVRAHTDLPVTHVILTHIHPDHVFGAAPFVATGAQVWGHEDFNRALADRAENYLESLEREIGQGAMIGTQVPVVTAPVAGRAELDLGGRVLLLEAWPMAHTGTDLTVHDLSTDTLFAGDLVFDTHLPALDGSLRGWRAVLAGLQGRGFARVVPGHGGPSLGWPEGGLATARYLSVLERDTRAAISAGARLGEAVLQIAAGEATQWALFDAYNARNATVAFTELEWE